MSQLATPWFPLAYVSACLDAKPCFAHVCTKPRHGTPLGTDPSFLLLSLLTCVAPPIFAIAANHPLQFRVAVSGNATTPSIVKPPPLPPSLPGAAAAAASRFLSAVAATAIPAVPRSLAIALRPLPPLSPPRPGPVRSAQERNVNVLPSRSRKNEVPSGAERSGPDQDRVRVRVS